jgi:hypothetical protein
LQGKKSDMLFCIVISGIPKIADRKFGVIPSLRFRTASELLILSFLHFGSGQRLSIFSVILTLSEAKGKNLILFRVSNSEESPQETLRLRLRVTNKK